MLLSPRVEQLEGERSDLHRDLGKLEEQVTMLTLRVER